MENCLFVAKYKKITRNNILSSLISLPQTLNNYELTIALYLVFSRYGKVVVVKASRDSAHRPFGFVEFSSIDGCKEALGDNERNGGIIIGGRKVRLEMARNTSKLYIKLPSKENVINVPQIAKFKPISIPNDENAFLIKMNGTANLQEFANQLVYEHPSWIVQIRNDQNANNLFGVAESAQRQSGLFQLRVPDSGVLPVSPATLAKIHSYSPALQYSVTPLEPIPELVPIAAPNHFMNRLYEDWHESGTEESFQDPSEARVAASRLNPSLGEWDGDVFFGRLDNQKVTITCLLEHCRQYGQISFLRLCNRTIIREDRVPVDSTAFVRFKFAESAKKCIEAENGSTWMGRIIKCEKCWNFLGRNTPPMSLESDKQ